jgi:hypothetical protein
VPLGTLCGMGRLNTEFGVGVMAAKSPEVPKVCGASASSEAGVEGRTTLRCLTSVTTLTTISSLLCIKTQRPRFR